MPPLTPWLPRGSGYRELTETASTKELDLSNHLSEVHVKPRTVAHVQEVRPRRHYRNKGLLKEKNFWLFLISMFVFLAMFVALRFLANRNPVHIRELPFRRTRYVRDAREEFPLLGYNERHFPGIVTITNHVIANLTVPGEITFSIFSPTFDDKTVTLKAKGLLAHNCSEDGNYGRAVVEVTDRVFYLYYFTPSGHVDSLIQVDTDMKGYNGSAFFAPREGHIYESAFIGNDVYIRTYTRSFARTFGVRTEYIELRSQKLRSINELLSYYHDVQLVVSDKDYYFICRGTGDDPQEFMIFIVKDGFTIRGFYQDRTLAKEHKLSLHFSDKEVKILEKDSDNVVVIDYSMDVEDLERKLNAF